MEYIFSMYLTTLNSAITCYKLGVALKFLVLKFFCVKQCSIAAIVQKEMMTSGKPLEHLISAPVA